MDYRYKVLDFENYDGDSFNLTVDLGFDLSAHIRVRIHGIDTPELRSKDEVYKKAAYLAKEKAREFVESGEDIVFVSKNYRGKFGRPLGDIEVDGWPLAQYMLDNNYAAPYYGQSKVDIIAAHESNVDKLIKRGEI